MFKQDFARFWGNDTLLDLEAIKRPLTGLDGECTDGVKRVCGAWCMPRPDSIILHYFYLLYCLA